MMNLFRCIIQALNLPTNHQPIHQPTLSPKATPVPMVYVCHCEVFFGREGVEMGTGVVLGDRVG